VLWLLATLLVFSAASPAAAYPEEGFRRGEPEEVDAGLRVPADLPEPGTLATVVDRLVEMVPLFTTGSVLSVSVIRLDTLERTSYNGGEIVKSASAVKALWMAAALANAGIDASARYAERALWASSDLSAGNTIDVAGGIDEVNRYVHNLGFVNTTVYEWSFGRYRRSRLGPGPLNWNNTTTSDDLAGFWQKVAYGHALGWAETVAFLEWTRGIKEDPDGNRLVARLPADVADASSWKMGWLPVGRNYTLGPGEVWPGGLGEGDTIQLFGGSVILGGGIIRLPIEKGHSYAIGVAAYEGRNWRGMTSWVEYASCIVYSVMSGDPTPCSNPRDQYDIANHTSPPAGEVTSIGYDHGFLTFEGWAADPDAWWQPTRVRVTLDGVPVGTVQAVPHNAEELLRPPIDSLELNSPRFDKFEVGIDPGLYEVCAIAINDGFGDSTLVGCHQVLVH
jgi:hypothetical protein